MHGDPAIRTLDPYSPYSIRTAYTPASPPPPYSLRKPTAYARISVPYPYSVHRLVEDSHRNLVGRESTDTVDRVRMPAEAVRSQYGLTLSAASAAYVKHEITFKIGLRIAAEIHTHSTDTFECIGLLVCHCHFIQPQGCKINKIWLIHYAYSIRIPRGPSIRA